MELVFEKLPKNLEEMKELEYASLAKPEYVPCGGEGVCGG